MEGGKDAFKENETSLHGNVKSGARDKKNICHLEQFQSGNERPDTFQ